MVAKLEFPSVRNILYDVLDGQEFAGDRLQAYFRLQSDYTDHLPAALIFSVGGQQTGPQKVERVRVDTYGVGTRSETVAEAINAKLTSSWHITDHGRIDRITVEVTPHDVPDMNPGVNLTSAVYRAVLRPLP